MGIFERFKQKDEADKSGAQAAAIKPANASSEKKSEKDSGTKKKAASKAKSVKTSELPAELRGVIKHPLVTEKAATLTSLSKYAFVVRPDASRVQVRSAVRVMYGVDPVSVNIIKVRGKRVRFGRTTGARKDWKKAIVTFPKGTTIDAYEGV